MREPTAPPPAERMTRNVRILLLTAVLFGLSASIYDTALPVYLDSVGISTQSMGWIYFVPALLAVALPLGIGIWSDWIGRKVLFALGLLVQGVATLLTPLFAGRWSQLAIKSTREPCYGSREALHSVLLREEAPARFITFFGRTRGAEFLSSFVGLLLAASALWLLGRLGVPGPVRWTLVAAGVIMIANGGMFALTYRETGFRREPAPPRVGWAHLLHPHLNAPLALLLAQAFVFNIGLGCSHAFAPQIFFLKKFHVQDDTLFVIMALHRLSIALPMLFAGRLVKRRLKEAFILFVIVEGLLITVPGYLASFWWATGLWLLHDFAGAGIWWPIQHSLILDHCREGSRGKQLTAVLALASFGTALGPLLAGYLSGVFRASVSFGVSMPFIAGGALMVLSAVFLVFLRRRGE